MVDIMKTKMTLVFLCFLFNTTVKANDRCAETFAANYSRVLNASKREKVNATKNLVAYLSALIEAQIIADPELLRFIDGLEKDVFVNPIHEEQAWISSASLIHREEIENYLTTTELDQATLLSWAKKSLKEKKRVREKREEVRQETQDVNQKMEFHPVPAGSFKMGEGKKVNVTLSHQVEVMYGPVTQKQWVELMGENPAKFAQGENQMSVSIKGKAIMLQPDHPIEQITWWSAVVFANKLSEKHGLPPAYDLSDIKWKSGTKAEDGTLDAESGEIKINAPKGDYYQAQGFRLPTEAEQEYLLRAAGTAEGSYHFGDNEAELKDHAWYYDNADQKTHAVAQLKPLIIDGKEFYDLHGNVWEWGWDWYGDKLKGGKDPVGPEGGSNRVFRGGSWGNFAQYCRSANRYDFGPGLRYGNVGFRLLRTID